MNTPLAGARLPTTALPHLARWRDRAGVRAAVRGNEVWVFWPASDEAVARHLLALPGARLAHRTRDAWLRSGEHLPLFDVPDADAAVPLDHLLAPEPLPPRPRSTPEVIPVTVCLVRDETPRLPSALRVTRAALETWAEWALTDDVEAVEAAACGGEALLMGRLPSLRGERFWGKQLLVASGWRPEPNLAEPALADALRLGEDLALFTPAGVEVVPRSAFGPLSRAGVRLAARGASA